MFVYLQKHILLLWSIAAALWGIIFTVVILIWHKERKKDASRKLITSMKKTFRECSPFYHPPKGDATTPEPTGHLDAQHLTDWQQAILDEITHKEQTILHGNSFAETYLNYHSRTGIDLIKMLADKGMRGEFQTFSGLTRHFGAQHVFSDVYFKLQDGRTSQVDLILLTNKEIYIIENKNFAGFVYGTEVEPEWTQYLGGKSYRFQNPIRQNEGHLRAFMEFFPQIPTERIVSLVVFNNLCKLKVEAATPVMSRDRLIATIATRQARTTTYFEGDELDLCSKLLMYCSLQSEDFKQQHIEYVNRVKNTVHH